MKLKEFEGKKLFSLCGINASSGILVKSVEEIDSKLASEKVYVAKVQTLQGGRGKKGGVEVVNLLEKAKDFVQKWLGKEFGSEIVNEILFDEKVEIEKELYLGVLFDRSLNCPVLIVSLSGGVEIEELESDRPEAILKVPINYVEGLGDLVVAKVKEFVKDGLSESVVDELLEVVRKVYDCFVKYDLRMVEINPLVVDASGSLVAVDAVCVFDDDARFRWEKKLAEEGVEFGERTGLREASEREKRAALIDKDDYRGVAGKTFLDLPGDIALLTSGGGASMTIADTIIGLGGELANFTEYSGNPPREKVEKLTRIVLDRSGLSGLLIAGVVANFTDIKETLSGVLDVLVEVKPKFPIVIRRAGPNDVLAKEMMLLAARENGLDIHYYGEEISLSEAAVKIVELSKVYKAKRLESGD